MTSLRYSSWERYVRLVIRDGGLCHYCKRRMNPPAGIGKSSMSIEHIVPRIYSGITEDDNLVLACRSCNNKRGEKLYTCMCDRCSNAYNKFLNGEPVRKQKKPRVRKLHKKWFVHAGGISYTYKSFEEAIRSLSEDKQ